MKKTAVLVMEDADSRHATFSVPEGDEITGPRLVDMPGSVWEELGKPDQVTVTIEVQP